MSYFRCTHEILSSVARESMHVTNTLEYKVSYLSKPYVCFFLTALQ